MNFIFYMSFLMPRYTVLAFRIWPCIHQALMLNYWGKLIWLQATAPKSQWLITIPHSPHTPPWVSRWFFSSQILLSHSFTQRWVRGDLSFLPADGEIETREYTRISWANTHFCSHSPIQNSITLSSTTTKGSGKDTHVGTQEEEQNVDSCEHWTPDTQPRH